jgi:hypothetical protein
VRHSVAQAEYLLPRDFLVLGPELLGEPARGLAGTVELRQDRALKNLVLLETMPVAGLDVPRDADKPRAFARATVLAALLIVAGPLAKQIAELANVCFRPWRMKT